LDTSDFTWSAELVYKRFPSSAARNAIARFLVGLSALLLATGCGSGAPAQITVTSTLTGQSTLPHRIRWEAKPSVPAAQITEVDFLIDGQLAWVENVAPFDYGDDGNWLVTSFLVPGEHAFTVRLVTRNGPIATSTVNAVVDAPLPPPAGLAGTWRRTVTAADVEKSTSGSAPPPGAWRLTIAAAGWEPIDPQGNQGLFDIGYQPAGTVEMRPTIEYPPYPNSNEGGFCNGVDPISNWTFATGSGRKTLTLHPAGKDPCGDRAAILEGTWSRVG
jgi:hypothetical protein